MGWFQNFLNTYLVHKLVANDDPVSEISEPTKPRIVESNEGKKPIPTIPENNGPIQVENPAITNGIVGKELDNGQTFGKREGETSLDYSLRVSGRSESEAAKYYKEMLGKRDAENPPSRK